MPTPVPTLSRDEARAAVAAWGFDRPAGGPPGPASGRRVGIELEWLALDAADLTRGVPLDRVRTILDALGPLPGGSALTFEPGGQVELSSPALPLSAVCEVTARDAAVLGDALARAGIALVALGLEPGPRRARALRTARYDAMEAFFDTTNGAGRTMMRSTAALQVNLDLGADERAVDTAADDLDRDRVDTQWRAVHDLGPVLAAAFANSPIGAQGPTGFRSTRLAVWSQIDPSRTLPPPAVARCRDAWAEYALAASVMLVRTSADRHVPVLNELRFDEWIEHGHALGYPTLDDLEYHLTTLFPPVRPRGWLELRVLDAVPAPWWRAAVAVTSVLVQRPDLLDRIGGRLAPARGRWAEAARCGLADPPLADAATACFTVALEALDDAGADRTTVDATREYLARYVALGRCPADDRLDAWRAGESPLPRPDNAVPATIGARWT